MGFASIRNVKHTLHVAGKGPLRHKKEQKENSALPSVGEKRKDVLSRDFSRQPNDHGIQNKLQGQQARTLEILRLAARNERNNFLDCASESHSHEAIHKNFACKGKKRVHVQGLAHLFSTARNPPLQNKMNTAVGTVSGISGSVQAYLKTLTTPSVWDRQTLFLVAGVSILIATVVFSWLSVSSSEKVRGNTVTSFQLSASASVENTQDAASAKKKAMTTAILATLGILLTLAGFPFAGGYMLGSI
jgi:hypothetical protein